MKSGMPQQPIWNREDVRLIALKQRVIEKIEKIGDEHPFDDADFLRRLEIELDQYLSRKSGHTLCLPPDLPISLSVQHFFGQGEDYSPSQSIISEVYEELERRQIAAMQMAREVGVSRQQVSRWMRGRDRVGEKSEARLKTWLEKSRTHKLHEEWRDQE